MCDLTGFVLVTATDDISARNLARLLVQDVLLKVGFCGLIVVNDGSTFKGFFKEVCSILNIDLHVAVLEAITNKLLASNIFTILE